MPVIILSCLVGGTSLCSNGPGNLVQTLPPCRLTLTWMRSVVVQKDARALPSPPSGRQLQPLFFWALPYAADPRPSIGAGLLAQETRAEID